MKKKVFTFVVMLIVPLIVYPQDTINLMYCLRQARGNHPRHSDNELLERIYQNNISNINRNWYPEMELNGRASYQSDVVEIGMAPVPGVEFPSPSKDQYKVYADIRQNLYDAGRTMKLKEVERAESLVAQKEVEAGLWNDLGVVKDLYFQVLIIQENQKILNLSISELQVNKKVIASAVKNGVRLPSDEQMLDLEIMNLQQETENLINTKKAILDVLNQKTGLELSPSDSFLLTDFQEPAKGNLLRPELEIYNLQISKLDKSAGLLASDKLPVLFAFGQLGYGNPGLNILKDDFDSWYLVGAGFRWTIWDWNSSARKRDNLNIQQELIENKKQDFENKIEDALTRQNSEIENHRQNIAKYKAMLDIRREITGTYRSMLENGDIKTMDYLKVLNDERKTGLKLAAEKIQYQKAIADYLYLQGNLTEN